MTSRPGAELPLRRHDAGEAVRDLQRRLAAVGVEVAGDEPGHFGDGTETAVRELQQARGLRVDGICGRQTWSALVEAGYQLGDRLLYLRQPMLRGDDVAALQRALGALGFDAGRVDGIFGPHTKAALDEFQRNAGLAVDGVCGPAVLHALARVGPPRNTGEPVVAAVREVEALRRAPRTLHGRRVAVGEGGGLHALATAVARVLADAGAVITVLHHPDPSEQAAEANAAQAEVFVGLALDPDGQACVTAHYAGHRYESPGGRRLAEMIQAVVPEALGLADGGVRGMALPVLKETRMPAVVCELGAADRVVVRAADLAALLGRVLSRWAAEPWEDVMEDPGTPLSSPAVGASVDVEAAP